LVFEVRTGYLLPFGVGQAEVGGSLSSRSLFFFLDAVEQPVDIGTVFQFSRHVLGQLFD
jgi:hypothetical protein